MKDDIAALKRLLRRHPRRTLYGAITLSLLCLLIALAHILYVPVPRHFKTVSGTVTGVNVAVGGSTTSLGYYAVIQITVEGKQHTFNGVVHEQAAHKKGDQVRVAYFPANPNVGRDLSDHPATLVDKGLLTVGALGLVFVAAWLFKVWWKAEDVPQDAEDRALDAEEAAEAARDAKAAAKDAKRREKEEFHTDR